jgi:hypothetical protein
LIRRIPLTLAAITDRPRDIIKKRPARGIRIKRRALVAKRGVAGGFTGAPQQLKYDNYITVKNHPGLFITELAKHLLSPSAGFGYALRSHG